MKKRVFFGIVLILLVGLALWLLTQYLAQNEFITDPSQQVQPEEFKDEKPVIYLYPPTTMDVTVLLELDGSLTCTYPLYEDGWHVTAHTDGSLIDHADGRAYSYLFWEGQQRTVFDFSKGFVIQGSDTLSFLQEKLEEIGLTPKEYNEFIVYWLPYMQDNAYNLISFQEEVYTNTAKLDIIPKPDSLLRVFMACKPLTQPMEIEEQTFAPFERKGFTVVEWGGSEVE